MAQVKELAFSLFARVHSALLDVEEESRRYREEHPEIELKPVGAVFVAAGGLALLYYYGLRRKTKVVGQMLSDAGFDGAAWNDLFTGSEGEYRRMAYWIGFVGVTHVVIPLLYARFVKPQASLADLGLKLKGAFSYWWVYVAMYLAILPALLIVSQTRSFSTFYPMYEHAHRNVYELLRWEAIYLPQFFFVEFLFRGFLLFSFRKRFGVYAVLLHLIPYCMIHFGKPLPETFGAILAGLVLGTVALLTRSIWMGVAVHCSVALTMDLLAIYARGGFG